VAPVFSIGIAEATGSWRLACVACALVALTVLVLLALNRDAIDDRQGSWAHERAGAGAAAAPKGEHPMAFLRLPSVWLCFSFFFFSTAALSAMQSFASPALQKMFSLPGTVTAFVVTGYMLCGAAGMVVGGFLVARSSALERNIGFAMAASAVLLLLAGTGWLPGLATAVIAAVAGFGTGLAGPSRDMLIKRASPPGATGRVYGTVYSGLDVGFAVSAPLFGSLLDHGGSGGIFYGAAAALVLGIVTASFVGLATRRRA
jgi:predicted MFS family arabinose efflux permease